MLYTTVSHINPQNTSAPARFYPSPVYGRTLTLNDLTREISHATSITPADVKAVVEELVEVFKRYLVRGDKIKIDGIGTFKVTFSGEGHIMAEKVSASDIDSTTIRVTFVADSQLKKTIRLEITFEKVKSHGQNEAGEENKESAETNNE